MRISGRRYSVGHPLRHQVLALDRGVGRAAAHGEIVARDHHHAAIHPAAPEHAVGRRKDASVVVGVVGGLPGDRADLVEAAGIEHPLDPLAHRQPPAGVLAGDPLGAAHLVGKRGADPQLLQFRLPGLGQERAQRRVVGHRRFFPCRLVAVSKLATPRHRREYMDELLYEVARRHRPHHLQPPAGAQRADLRDVRAAGRDLRRGDGDRRDRALILTGAGDKAFAAGTDIGQFRAFTSPRTRSSTRRGIDRVLGRAGALPRADHRRDSRRLHRRRRGDRRVLRPADRRAQRPIRLPHRPHPRQLPLDGELRPPVGTDRHRPRQRDHLHRPPDRSRGGAARSGW